MQLKAFEAGRYDEKYIVILNPENGKQEIFTEEEFEIAKFLKQNENESLLALLLPNIGVARKDHIMVCLKVLRKLKRMQIVDYFAITGRKILSNTNTIEIDMDRRRLPIPGLDAIAAVITSVGEKCFGWLGPHMILLLCLGLAAFSFVFFPFDQVEKSLNGEGLRYPELFLSVYFTASAALLLRGLMRAAFLRAVSRRVRQPQFAFFFPFIDLIAKVDEVNILGYRSRLQLGFIGLLAPMALSALFTGLQIAGIIDSQSAFFGFAACVLVSLMMACPFFTADTADILHVIFLRDELTERISTGLRDIFRTKASLSREMLFGLLASFVWLLVWLDSLRSFWETIADPVTDDFMSGRVLRLQIGAGFVLAILAAMLLMPVAIFSFNFLREKFLSQRRRIVVKKDELKESLSFEERMAALEKIPLFAYLNDQERLSLLNEMQPAFFAHGEYLVHQGEVGREFYVLVKGHANAFHTDLTGRNFLLADLGEGDAFGEIALIDDVPRTASIISDGGCLVLTLKKEGFDRFAMSLGSPDRVKTLIRLTSFFRRHPLFSKLGVKDQAQLIDTFNFESLTIGQEIPNNEENFYVIYSGKVRMDTGDDSVDVTLLPDDCFGYANALNAKYFSLEGSGLLSVRREEFYSLIWEKLVERPELFV